MELCSTRDAKVRVSFRDALIRGIAPEGGLYLPISIPRIGLDEFAEWRSLSFADLSVAIAKRVIGDEFPGDVIERLVGGALDFPVPIIEVEPGRFVLELFHGPTLAFKDFGARFLARFFGYILAERGEHATILVATSGDTGGAVAHGFHGVPNVRVVVLYPEGKVSPFQEAQMATLGGNVTAVRVWGDFDDCQRLVKQAFLDRRLTRSASVVRQLHQHRPPSSPDLLLRACVAVRHGRRSPFRGVLRAERESRKRHGWCAVRLHGRADGRAHRRHQHQSDPGRLLWPAAATARGPRWRPCRARWTWAIRATCLASSRSGPRSKACASASR